MCLYCLRKGAIEKNISLSGQTVGRECLVRNLGLHMDERLNFEYHMNNMVKRAFGKLKTAWKYW